MKQYDSTYPEQLVITEFEKSKNIYQILSKRKIQKIAVKTPRPLLVDKKRRIIIFEYVPDVIEIKKFFFINSNLLKTDKKSITHVICEIACAVAYIHLNLKLKSPEKFSPSTIKDTAFVPLLADLCNSNILLNDKGIYLVDFSPSLYMYPVKTCNILGSRYLDLVHLIYAYKFPPIYSRPFYSFISGYVEEILLQHYFSQVPQNLNMITLCQAKEYYLQRYLSSLKTTPLYWYWKRIIQQELCIVYSKKGDSKREL